MHAIKIDFNRENDTVVAVYIKYDEKHKYICKTNQSLIKFQNSFIPFKKVQD